jgi:hypothetical protein
MIRRFYILPLNPGVGEAQVQDFLRTLNTADQFIPGLLDSSAGVDFDSRTVLWENTFVDEATYSGPYMVHPYHAGAIDDFVMADSPLCVTHDIYTTRYQLPGEIPRIEKGVRRLVLMNLAEGADAAALEALAARPQGMATSVFRPDDVGWVSAKGRPWTHIWEQGFTDLEALGRYLATRDGVTTSSLEGLKRLGVDVAGLKILACPFALKPAQSPVPITVESCPTFYTITARTAPEDVDAYVGLLETCYDPYVAEAGGKLVQRWRTVEQGYGLAEVQSTWEIKSVAAYHDLRLKTGGENWKRFVRDAMPLVKGGSRRFYRAV